MLNGINFTLHTIKNVDKDDIIVSDDLNRQCEDSYFTLITGENGCGKSSLLTKAVNSFIFNGSKYNVSLARKSLESPSRVIAICNSRYNRFPLIETFIRKKNNNIRITIFRLIIIWKLVRAFFL